jgi:hypothetical protein
MVDRCGQPPVAEKWMRSAERLLKIRGEYGAGGHELREAGLVTHVDGAARLDVGRVVSTGSTRQTIECVEQAILRCSPEAGRRNSVIIATFSVHSPMICSSRLQAVGATMSLPWRRAALTAVLSAGCVVAGVLVAVPAQAAPVEAGTVTLTSEPGDFIGAGGTYAYSVAGGDVLFVGSSRVAADDPVNGVAVDVEAANGDRWRLSFAAPTGQPLVVGDYPGAARIQDAGVPGLDVNGNGRGCNTVVGSFTVTDAVYGLNGYVQTFAVSFEQHCDGDAAALRGQVRIDNPANPAPTTIGVTVAKRGTVDRTGTSVTVEGAVICSRAVQVDVDVEVTQTVGAETVFGHFFPSVSCTPGAKVPWQATVLREVASPFQRGTATVQASAFAFDPVFGTPITAEAVTVVRLRRA